MEKTRIKYLFQRYLDNKLNDAELAELQAALAGDEDIPGLDELVEEALHADTAGKPGPDLSADQYDRFEERVWQRVAAQSQRRPALRQHLPWLVAAAVMLIAVVAHFFLVVPLSPGRNGQSSGVHLAPIPEGHRRASLIRPDGQEIPLRTGESTLFLDGDGIRYADCEYIFRDNYLFQANAMYTIRTPAGGQYDVVLPDGSRVRLNAGSSLRTPLHFRGRPRQVAIEGEGHFSITRRRMFFASAPFSVQSQGQNVQVLGTEFSISAYPDDPEVKTTLYTGAVRVQADHGGSLLLEPGEQSTLNGEGQLRKRAVDSGQGASWQTGYIDLDGKSFRQVMRELARWYGLEVVYEDEAPNVVLYGKLAVTTPLATVLKVLTDEGVSLRETRPGRIVISTPKTESGNDTLDQ